MEATRAVATVYDEELNAVKVDSSEKRRSSAIEETLEGGKVKQRNRAKCFINDSKARSDCRYKRRKGLIKSLRDFKLTTGDECYL